MDKWQANNAALGALGALGVRGELLLSFPLSQSHCRRRIRAPECFFAFPHFLPSHAEFSLFFFFLFFFLPGATSPIPHTSPPCLASRHSEHNSRA